MTSWKKRWAFGVLLLAAGGCEVSTGDGDFDGFGGRGGTSSTGGTSSSAGRGGSAGSAGRGGSAGSMSMVDAGTGGTNNFPDPVCTAEDGDASDPCIQCVKAECCTPWQGCDDQTCFDEWEDIRLCMEGNVFPTEEDYAECNSESAADGMLPQPNTNALLACVVETVDDADSGVSSARCGQVCLNLDILLTQ